MSRIKKKRTPNLALLALLAAAILLLTMPGCENSDDSGEVTYYKHIEPLVQKNCVSCHRPNNIGPFSLETYNEVKANGARALKAITDRIMPPWTIKNNGDCQDFEEAAWLTDSDIEVFADWVNADMPEGSKDDSGDKWNAPAHLVDFTHTATMPEYTPLEYYEQVGVSQLPSDDYRCFIVDLPFIGQKYLTEFEVMTESPLMAHHMILYILSGVTLSAAEAAADAEAGPGYTCYGGPSPDVAGGENFSSADIRAGAGWAPGTPFTLKAPE